MSNDTTEIRQFLRIWHRNISIEEGSALWEDIEWLYSIYGDDPQ